MSSYILNLENDCSGRITLEHLAQVEITYVFIKEYGFDEAKLRVPKVFKNCLKALNSKRMYSETITQFWIYMIYEAMLRLKEAEEFSNLITNNLYLGNTRLPREYYSQELISSSESFLSFIEPDLKPLPKIK